MKQSTTLKSFKSKVWISAGIIGIIQYTGLITSLIRSSSKPFIAIVPILVTYAVGLTTYYYKNISYLCPNCQHTFKPSLKQFILARHTMQTRKLECPKCHETHSASKFQMRRNRISIMVFPVHLWPVFKFIRKRLQKRNLYINILVYKLQLTQ